MQEFRYFCKLYNEMKALKDILPENLCPLAFHAIYPYILTLSNGGWFNWVGDAACVIVHCPSPAGITMHVKYPTKDSPNLIEVTVADGNSDCYRRHKPNDTFIFNIGGDNMARLKLLDNDIPFVPAIDGALLWKRD